MEHKHEDHQITEIQKGDLIKTNEEKKRTPFADDGHNHKVESKEDPGWKKHWDLLLAHLF